MSVAGMCPWCGEYKVIRGVRVLHVNLTPNAAFEQAAFELLDASERSRLGRFRVARPRTQYSLCRAALRLALCEAIGCSNRELSFEFREHGKPFAKVGGKEAAIRFNVSHSEKHGLIAVGGEGRLGIDAEVRERSGVTWWASARPSTGRTSGRRSSERPVRTGRFCSTGYGR